MPNQLKREKKRKKNREENQSLSKLENESVYRATLRYFSLTKMCIVLKDNVSVSFTHVMEWQSKNDGMY